MINGTIAEIKSYMAKKQSNHLQNPTFKIRKK